MQLNEQRSRREDQTRVCAESSVFGRVGIGKNPLSPKGASIDRTQDSHLLVTDAVASSSDAVSRGEQEDLPLKP
jgi:hypothetical protein